MNKFAFRKLYDEFVTMVKEEGKTNPSWLMGYLQGRGNRTLTGYQCAALVDLLLVHPEKPECINDASVPVANHPVNTNVSKETAFR